MKIFPLKIVYVLKLLVLWCLNICVSLHTFVYADIVDQLAMALNSESLNYAKKLSKLHSPLQSDYLISCGVSSNFWHIESETNQYLPIYSLCKCYVSQTLFFHRACTGDRIVNLRRTFQLERNMTNYNENKSIVPLKDGACPKIRIALGTFLKEKLM